MELHSNTISAVCFRDGRHFHINSRSHFTSSHHQSPLSPRRHSHTIIIVSQLHPYSSSLSSSWIHSNRVLRLANRASYFTARNIVRTAMAVVRLCYIPTLPLGTRKRLSLSRDIKPTSRAYQVRVHICQGIVFMKKGLFCSVPSLFQYIVPNYPTPYVLYEITNCKMLSLPSFCLSLLLLSLPSESFAAHQRDYFRGLRHAPRDFRDYPAVARRDASGTIGTGTGTASGVPTGTGSPYLNTSNTYSPDWKSKGMSVGSQSDFVPSTSTVLTTSVSTVTATTTVTVLPAYEVCDVDGVSCSTISTTSTTTICSAVLTGFFTRVTVTDCDQSVTFSTKSSYSMITAAPTAVQARRAEVTGSLQSIVSYFIAPWQSIAANNPSGITIKVCTVSDSGVVTCNDVQEVWVVLTVTVPVVRTSTVTVSQYLPTVSQPQPI